MTFVRYFGTAQTATVKKLTRCGVLKCPSIHSFSSSYPCQGSGAYLSYARARGGVHSGQVASLTQLLSKQLPMYTSSTYRPMLDIISDFSVVLISSVFSPFSFALLSANSGGKHLSFLDVIFFPHRINQAVVFLWNAAFTPFLLKIQDCFSHNEIG